jgi:hypothetical protein
MRHSPIFIVGSPRSGTTLLASLLAPTPWGTPFESHFIPKYFADATLASLADRAAFCALAARILRERPIAQHRLTTTPDELYDGTRVHDYASLVDGIGRAVGRTLGAESWGDKTPHYVNDVDILHSLFPRSKMIYLVRDGRDVAVSLLKKPWGPASIYACALKWRHENRLQPILDTLRGAGQLYDLRYEELLRSPETALASLYTFLGVDASLDDIRLRTASIRRANTGSWRRQLSASQVKVFEQLAGQTLTRFGYGVTHPPAPVPWPARVRYTAQDACKQAVHLFNVNLVDGVRIRFFGMEPFAQ